VREDNFFALVFWGEVCEFRVFFVVFGWLERGELLVIRGELCGGFVVRKTRQLFENKSVEKISGLFCLGQGPQPVLVDLQHDAGVAVRELADLLLGGGAEELGDLRRYVPLIAFTCSG